jgi:hypothetical protein
MKTADEVAAETAAQLAELERKRTKRTRQRGSDDEDSDDEDGDARKGGYAAKRQKRAAKGDAEAPRKQRKQTVRSWARLRHWASICLLKPARSQGDDLEGNYALDGDEGDDGDDDDGGSDPSSSGEDEGGSSDDAEDEDDLRASFKKRVGSINQQGDLSRGLRRLRPGLG